MADLEDVKVRVVVKAQASPADQGWLRLEFENGGKEPVEVKDLQYWANGQVTVLSSGRGLFDGGLGEGALLAAVVRPGVTLSFDSPADYAMARLGVPPAEQVAWRVDARLSLRLELNDGRKLDTPAADTKFTFNWVRPDKDGFDAMAARLRKCVREPDRSFEQGYVLTTLLKVPELDGAVPLQNLLDGLTARSQPNAASWPRHPIVRKLAAKYAKNPGVISYYTTALDRGDAGAADDLWLIASDIWDDRFIPPLVRMSEGSSDYPTQKSAWSLLDRHHQHWENDPAVRAHLLAAVLESYPAVGDGAGKADLTDESTRRVVEDGLKFLGMTHDPAAVTVLRPWLDENVVLFDWEGIAELGLDAPRVPMRACDLAYNAILKVTRLEQRAFELDPRDGRDAAPETKEGVRRELARRDEAIRTLKKERDVRVATRPAR